MAVSFRDKFDIYFRILSKCPVLVNSLFSHTMNSNIDAGNYKSVCIPTKVQCFFLRSQDFHILSFPEAFIYDFWNKNTI
jgi:hypothetical protein